jgi:hypothetical protein
MILRANELYIKLKKCKFFTNEIEFLGHTINSDGKRPLQEKINKALDFPTPRTKKHSSD